MFPIDGCLASTEISTRYFCSSSRKSSIGDTDSKCHQTAAQIPYLRWSARILPLQALHDLVTVRDR